MSAETELLAAFFDETYPLVVQADAILNQIDTISDSSLRELRRVVHTIKGNARVMELTRVANAAHELETLLDRASGEQGAVHLTSLKKAQYLMTQIDQMLAEFRLKVENRGQPAISFVLPDGIDAELMEGFLEEAEELCEQLHAALPANPPDIPFMQRMMHTLKGGARMVGLENLGTCAYQYERLFADVRDMPLQSSQVKATLREVNQQGMPELERLLLQAKDYLQSLSFVDLNSDVSPEEIESPLSVTLPEMTSHESDANLSDSDLEMDHEIFNEFVNETQDLFRKIQELLAEPLQSNGLRELRRMLHTIKGGANMVGLKQLGNAAHELETQLDRFCDVGQNLNAEVQAELEGNIAELQSILLQASLSTTATATATVSQPEISPSIISTKNPTEPLIQRIVQPLAIAQQTLEEWRKDPSQTHFVRLQHALEVLCLLSRESTREIAYGLLKGALDLLEHLHSSQNTANKIGALLEQALIAWNSLICDDTQEAQIAASSIRNSMRALQAAEISSESFADEELDDDELEAPAPSVQVKEQDLQTKFQPQKASDDVLRVKRHRIDRMLVELGMAVVENETVNRELETITPMMSDLVLSVSRLKEIADWLKQETESRLQSTSYQQKQTDFDPLEMDRFTELNNKIRMLEEVSDDMLNFRQGMTSHLQVIRQGAELQGKHNSVIQNSLLASCLAPFSLLSNRLQRVTRRAAEDMGKKIGLLIDGDDVELDRGMLDTITAPLEHLLRNAVAHGIEMPEERRAANKSEVGAISLSVTREGAEIVIRIADDGAGFKYDVIREKAISKGLIRKNSQPTREELNHILLQPGFTTAQSLSQIAGRGVGLDVVNASLSLVRGYLELQSVPGQGSLFELHLPMLMMVTPALMVEVGGRLLSLLVYSIDSVVPIKAKDYQRFIAHELARDVIEETYADRRYTIGSLGRQLGIPVAKKPAANAKPHLILLRESHTRRRVALCVDNLLDNRKILVKPGGAPLKAVPWILGIAQTNNGLALVLDPIALVNLRPASGATQLSNENNVVNHAKQQVMVVDDSVTMRRITSKLLTAAGFDVLTARDGLEGLEMLERVEPTAMILDVEMPRMDGFELLAHIRKQPKLKNLPVIMATSRGGQKHIDYANQLGASGYLVKPFSKDMLLAELEHNIALPEVG